MTPFYLFLALILPAVFPDLFSDDENSNQGNAAGRDSFGSQNGFGAATGDTTSDDGDDTDQDTDVTGDQGDDGTETAGGDTDTDNTDSADADTDDTDSDDTDTDDTDSDDTDTDDTDSDDTNSDENPPAANEDEEDLAGIAALEDFFDDDDLGQTDTGSLDTEFASVLDTSTRTAAQTPTEVPLSGDIEFIGGDGNDTFDVQATRDALGEDRKGITVVGGAGDDLVRSTSDNVNILLSGAPEPDEFESATFEQYSDVFYSADNGNDIAIIEAATVGVGSANVFIDDGDEVILEPGSEAQIYVKFEPDAKVMIRGFNHEDHTVVLDYRLTDGGSDPDLQSIDRVDGIQILTYQNGFQLMFDTDNSVDNSRIFSTINNSQAAWGADPSVDPYKITAADAPNVETGDATLDAILNNDDADVFIGSEVRDYVSENRGNPSVLEDTQGAITLNNDTFIAGYEGNDELYGEYGSDAVFGGKGEDDLYGGASNPAGSGEFTQWDSTADALFGGEGEDTLYLEPEDYGHGGEGGDRFEILHNAEPGVYTILDFDKREDELIIETDIEGNSVTANISVSGGDTVISLSNGSSVILRGVTNFTPVADEDNLDLDKYFYVF